MDSTVPNTKVKILFFAKARELTGLQESIIAIPRELPYSDLVDRVIVTFKLESIRDNVILALNEEFVGPGGTIKLSEKDEIAIIPPLSGGINMNTAKDFVKLQKEKLDSGDVCKLVTSAKCGAISSFIGTTRDHFEGKKVIKLEYEAYEPMAKKEMINICAKIRAQWNVEHIAIFHRLGEVPVSEASVIIAISSAHRQESLRAVDYAIEALKMSVPIWKKEIYEGEEPQWKENKECNWSKISNEKLNTQNNKNKMPAYNTQNVQRSSDASIKEEIEKDVLTDPNIVQIRASPDELNHRIESFIARKRQQVNIVNVQEFCCHRDQNKESEDSCARVDAILVRRKDSKSHVKVHRVSNTWGPQMVDQSLLHKATTYTTNLLNNIQSSVLDERICTSERILGINKPVPRDIYERLKNIESRILYLEGVSPEYKDFWGTEDVHNLTGAFQRVRKRTFSMAELDSKLHELEDKYAKKMK